MRRRVDGGGCTKSCRLAKEHAHDAAVDGVVHNLYVVKRAQDELKGGLLCRTHQRTTVPLRLKIQIINI